MPTESADCYYIVTTTSKERSDYTSLESAVAALTAMLELQSARGYKNDRNPSGRYMSKHPDNPPAMFWIEDTTGKILS